jgi:DNA-binding SARP family transcriptional activator
VDVRILGSLELVGDEGPITIKGMRRRSLVGRLAISANRVVLADRLVEDVWAEDAQARVEHTLQATIYQLRRLLGTDGERLRSDSGGYVLDVSPDELDASRFEALLAAARMATHDPVVRSERLATALALWRGPVLGELSGAPWLVAEASRWETLRAHAQDEWAEVELALGHHTELVAFLEGAAAAEPLRERRTAQLMIALYRSGRQADALRAYRNLRSGLVDELGLEPSAELAALEGAILRQDSALEGPPRTRASPSVPQSGPREVTLLFTDIEGSTRLLRELGTRNFERILSTHHLIVRGELNRCGGTELSVAGDGFVLSFPIAGSALDCAIAIQRGLAQRVRPDGSPLRVRMALHAGETQEVDAGAIGMPLHEASRVLSTVNGGQLVITDVAQRRLTAAITETIELVDMGEHVLRDLETPLRLYRVVAPGLTNDTPLRLPAPEPLPTGVPAPVTAARRLSIFGREPELAAFRQVWKDVVRGERRVVLIEGEPGIGKTRLAAEAAAEAAEGGACVLWGRCDENAGAPFQPFSEALRDRLATLPPADAARVVGPSADHIAPLVPGGHRPGYGVSADDPVDRSVLFDAVAEVLNRLAQGQPLVVVSEDLHWVSTPTVLLLRNWLRRSLEIPLLWIATLRPMEITSGHSLSPLLAELAIDPTVVTLAPADLNTANLEDMARELGLAAPTGGTATLAKAVYRRTGGSPLLSSQLLRELSDRPGALSSELLAENNPTLPSALRHIVDHRLDRLPDGSAVALGVAAVVGTAFFLGTVEEVLEKTDDGRRDLLTVFEAAARARLVEEMAEPGQFQFVHALVRDSLISQMSATRRARLHHHIADVLAPRGVDAPTVAHHYACAGTDARAAAIEWLERAGAHHQQHFAYEDAVAALQRALHLIRRGQPQDRERASRVHRSLAFIFALIGSIDESKEHAALAATEAKEAGATELLVQAVGDRITYGRFGVFDPLARELLHEALDEVKGDHPHLRAYLLASLAFYEASTEGKGWGADPLAADALALARASGDDKTLGEVLALRTFVLQGSGDVALQVAMLDEFELWLQARKTPLADPVAGLRSIWLRNSGIVRLQTGDRPGFCAALTEIHELAVRRHDWLMISIANMWRALLAALDGHFDDARNHSDEMRARTRHDANFETSWGALRFHLARERGNLAAIESVVLDVARDSTQPALVALEPLVHLDRDRVELAHDAASRLADHGLDAIIPTTAGAVVLAALAETWTRVPQHDRLADLEQYLLPYRGQLLVVAWGVYVLGAADRYLGMLASACCRWAEADDLFASALELEECVGSRPLATRTRMWWARALVERNAHSREAENLLDQAADDAAALGMTRLSTEIDRLRRRSDLHKGSATDHN